MNVRSTRSALLASEDDHKTWSELLRLMRSSNPEICRLWFDHLQPLRVVSGVLYVRAHSSVHQDYLQRACLAPFNEALQSVSGRLLSVRFLGPTEDIPGQAATPRAAAQPPLKLADAPGTPPPLDPSATAAPPMALPAEHANGHAVIAEFKPDPNHAGSPGAPDSHAPPARSPLDPMHPSSPAQPSGSERTRVQRSHTPHAGGAGGVSGGAGGAGSGAVGGAEGDAGRRGNPPATHPTPRLPTIVIREPLAHSPFNGSPRPGSPPHHTLSDLYVDGLVINPDYDFENFVVGPNNRLAHAGALAVAANPGRAYNPYFVHGKVGLGKTHLLQAMCLHIRATRPNTTIYYTSCEGFATQFFDAVAAGEMTRFRYKFRHVDVLVVDDIHFLAQRERIQEEFFHTFNTLWQSQKQVVLSSDAPPEHIPDLEDRVVSRFKSGLVSEVTPPSFETREEILKKKARLRGFELPPEVASFVAQRFDSNIRELEGAVQRLQAYALSESAPISLELARAALGDPESRSEPRVPVQMIIEVVTAFYDIKATDLQGRRRQRSIAHPRQVCMYLARKLTRFSLEEIGGYFGGRDHTTVLHAINTITDRTKTDLEFAASLTHLESQLRSATA
ncbi:MAG: chromosomal replication initiator protein DnaA [Planctomyces sp.]|nr:chromosomal replication initiator protein DnaA [Planctomyces sp.]MBA4039285.1 chromosomal replication initiator protein DnaA [Planctomyces sp.]